MATPPLSDVPPGAREAVAAVLADPAATIKVMVTGGIGTGKSTALAAVRAAWRDAGRRVLTRAPGTADAPGAAVLVDDADLLSDDELSALTDLVGDAAATVVVAAQPRSHRNALRALATALSRENPVSRLGPLAPAGFAECIGAEATRDVLRELFAATAGLPFLVGPALAAADGQAAAKVRFALAERLRDLDGPLLDTLLITSLSPELGPDDVAAALHVPPAEALELVDRARSTGLIEPSHPRPFLHSLHRAVNQITGAARHRDVELALTHSQIAVSALSVDLALSLAEHGLRDDALAGALLEMAERAATRPEQVARLYRAAAQAGTTAPDTRLADALALTGDCTAAARLADDLLGCSDPAQRAAAVRISASVAIHDGATAHAAELFGWLGSYPDAQVTAAGVTATLGAGAADIAKTLAAGQDSGPPTSTARAARRITEGLLHSLSSPFPVTIAALGQSISGDRPGSITPDTPAALVTLAALHGGDPLRARSVIARALQAGADQPFWAARHRLLQGWARMQEGQLSAAAADVDAAGSESGGTLHRRDALWAAALHTAIARRSGDTGALLKQWYIAMEVLAEYSVDLFSLLPLGELWVAGARLRQLERVQHAVDGAFTLLDALGRPVLWSVPLHWAGVHAGILSNSPEAVAPHGQALAAAGRAGPGHSAFARALAAAGRAWLQVLAGQVNTDEVAPAARTLSQFGLTWDATRLAGQAALHASEPRIAAAMLQLARDLKQQAGEDTTREPTAGSAGSAPTAGNAPARAQQTPAALSDREREVAELLLLGMPYRDIGSQLFISAKTVEHHVARIRRRLGAGSRSEMLSMLRAMLPAAEHR